MDKDITEEIFIYRAVGVEEYYSIIDNHKFICDPQMSEVKYFAFDFEETLLYANKAYNSDVVAIFQTRLKKCDLNRLGDFTHVDPSIFKSGTVIVQLDKLDLFNACVIETILKM